MARARNIKPGFFKNEDLAECSPWARLCFAGLWTLADREGRLEDRVKRIKGELFPFDSIEVEPLLDELTRWGFIKRYEVDGGRYIFIVKFAEHQPIHGLEKDGTIPDENGFLTVHERTEKGFATGKATLVHHQKTSFSCRQTTNENSCQTVIDGGQPPPENSSKPVFGLDPPPPKNSCQTVVKQFSNSYETVSDGRPRGGENPLNAECLNAECLNAERLNPSPAGDGCAEQLRGSPPTVSALPLADGSEFSASGEDASEWGRAFPGVDVGQEMLRMRVWLLANPQKRKTARGVRAFVVRWLGKARDGAKQTAPDGRRVVSDWLEEVAA